MTAPLLAVRHLRIHFPQRGLFGLARKPPIRAVDGVGFNLNEAEALGIVGESGCGKSTLARALVGLQNVTDGSISYQGQNLTMNTPRQWRGLRREIQMVFQDPLASLDPRMSIGRCIAEPLEFLCPELGARERSARVLEVMDRVGLSRALIHRYPHEFSGGQCQRVGIARALVVRPRILVCDEPVSALDVSVQAQILNLLSDLRREQKLSMLFIAHDLAVVRHLCQRVMVMYLGKVMEYGQGDALFRKPAHPYTRALLGSLPAPDLAQLGLQRELLGGELPSPANPPQGCVFVTRCPIADSVCGLNPPVLARAVHGGHSACHFTTSNWAAV